MSVKIESVLPTCPKCKKVLDGATHAGGEDDLQPSAGDLSVCLYCTSVLQFQEDLSLSEMTEDEIEELPPEVVGQIRIVKASIINFEDKKGS